MSQIKNRSFNAEPKELVPSKGINEIQDNIIQSSFELWSLINLFKEGSAGFAPLMFSNVFNVDTSEQSSYVSFQYNSNGDIISATAGDNKIVNFYYNNNQMIDKIVISFNIDSTIISKTITFNYDNNDNIINVNIL